MRSSSDFPMYIDIYTYIMARNDVSALQLFVNQHSSVDLSRPVPAIPEKEKSVPLKLSISNA